jgi:cephalosporin-C deacetylase-like acetyl esterase
MMRCARNTLLWLCAAALVSCTAQRTDDAALLSVGRALLSYDQALPLEPQVSARDAEGVYSITYTSAHGERVPAVLALPTDREGKVGCVLLMHGLGGKKEYMETFWEQLTKQGYACFAIDAKYHGERPKGAAGMSLLDYPYDARDALAQTVIDLRRGLDYLATRDEIDMARIGYVGVSMGAILGAITSGVDERIASTVLVVGGGDWSLITEKTVLPLASGGKLKNEEQRKAIVEALAPLDPLLWVGHISPRPLLMINGEKDQVVPVESNKALHAAAKEPKKIVWFPGGHMPPADLLKDEVTAWFGEHLGGED